MKCFKLFFKSLFSSYPVARNPPPSWAITPEIATSAQCGLSLDNPQGYEAVKKIYSQLELWEQAAFTQQYTVKQWSRSALKTWCILRQFAFWIFWGKGGVYFGPLAYHRSFGGAAIFFLFQQGMAQLHNPTFCWEMIQRVIGAAGSLHFIQTNKTKWKVWISWISQFH